MNNNKKISIEQLGIFEIEKGFVFPDAYRKFLIEHNGYSFDGGILIYEFEELYETNQYMQINEYVPNYFAIGDDGGGLVFLMKQARESVEVFIVDLSDYNIEQCYEKIGDFTDWFQKGCPIRNGSISDSIAFGEQVDIELTSQPINGLKDLIKIKSIFNLQISTSEFLQETRKLPYTIVKDITYVKALKLIEKVGQLDIFSFKKN